MLMRFGKTVVVNAPQAEIFENKASANAHALWENYRCKRAAGGFFIYKISSNARALWENCCL